MRAIESQKMRQNSLCNESACIYIYAGVYVCEKEWAPCECFWVCVSLCTCWPMSRLAYLRCVFLKFNLYLWFHFSGMFLAFVHSCVCVCVWVEWTWMQRRIEMVSLWFSCGFLLFSCVFSVWIFLLSNTHGEVAAWPVLCLSLSLSLNNALCTINHHSNITASHIGRSTRFKQVGFVTTEHR